MAGVPRWYYGFVRWRKRNISGRTTLVVLAFAAGIVAGAATRLLRGLIAMVTGWCMHFINPGGCNILFIILPLVGLLLAVCFQRFVVHDDLSHSEARLRQAFKAGNYRLKPHMLWAPLAACPVTLGFGGSAGSEGPSALIGAAGASTLGRYMGCGPLGMRTLVACGAGAGIAGIFTAPVSGVMFAVEVIGIELTSFGILLLFVSCLSAAGTSFILSGDHLNLSFFVEQSVELRYIWIFMILGLACGLYSCYYTYLVSVSDKCLRKIPVWWRTVAAGLILGAVIFLLPPLYGEGSAVMRHLSLDCADYSFLTSAGFFHSLTTMGPGLLLLVAAMLLVKSLAVDMTNSGGGVAGVFTPTMMAGALFGMMFAQLANQWLGTDLPLPLFAFVAMAGTMSGVLKAPLLGTFVVTEISGDYLLILPVAVVAFASYFVRMMINPGDVILSPARLLTWQREGFPPLAPGNRKH